MYIMSRCCVLLLQLFQSTRRELFICKFVSNCQARTQVRNAPRRCHIVCLYAGIYTDMLVILNVLGHIDRSECTSALPSGSIPDGCDKHLLCRTIYTDMYECIYKYVYPKVNKCHVALCNIGRVSISKKWHCWRC